jgi:hypothetical protein
MTKQDVVISAIAAFADLENALRVAQTASLKLGDIATDAQVTGLFTWGQMNDYQKLFAELQSELASDYASVLRMHRECTRLAQAAGADVANPDGGGTRNA